VYAILRHRTSHLFRNIVNGVSAYAQTTARAWYPGVNATWFFRNNPLLGSSPQGPYRMDQPYQNSRYRDHRFFLGAGKTTFIPSP